MEINPHVRRLMEQYAPSQDTFDAWVAYHESVTLEDVELDGDRIEREELADLYGWDVDEDA